MPEYKYKYVDVSGTANAEELEDILTSSDVERYHIDGLYFHENTGTLQHDAIIRAYIERERIIDMPVATLLADNGTDTRYNLPFVELDTDLPVGLTLSVGHLSGSTASDFQVTVKYHIVS